MQQLRGRGRQHGHNQWQEDCAKDVDAKRGADESEKIHRPSQRTKRQVQGNLSLTSRGTHVVSIPEKVSDVSSEKPVAVTLITEFQVYLTQPSRKKTRIARKPSKDFQQFENHPNRSTKPFWKDGTMLTNTVSLCQMLVALRNRSFNTMKSQRKTIPASPARQERSRNGKKPGNFSLNKEGMQ